AGSRALSDRPLRRAEGGDGSREGLYAAMARRRAEAVFLAADPPTEQRCDDRQVPGMAGAELQDTLSCRRDGGSVGTARAHVRQTLPQVDRDVAARLRAGAPAGGSQADVGDDR